MFRTFAVRVVDLLEDAARAEWDAKLSKFEQDVEIAGCGIVSGGSSTSDGICSATFHVKGLERVMMGNGQSIKQPIVVISPAEFEKKLANGQREAEAGSGFGSDRPGRVLR